MNKIVLIGRLTKDPELRFAAGSGTAIANFTLAANRPHIDKSKPQEADFINCVAFGKRAEAIAQYVFKGHQFAISGRLQVNKYVDKEGNNRWSSDVLVEDFDFIQSKKDSTNNYSSNQGFNQSTDSFGGASYDDDMTPIDDGDIPF